jgi:hypothetical protein
VNALWLFDCIDESSWFLHFHVLLVVWAGTAWATELPLNVWHSGGFLEWIQ